MREKINKINEEKQALNQEINEIKQQLQNNNILIDDLNVKKFLLIMNFVMQ